jgi:hypothetical protein
VVDAAPVPDARAAASPARHVRANAILQTVLIPVHVLFTMSAGINLALTLTDAGDAGPLAGLYPTWHEGTEKTAAMVTYAWIGLWSVLGVVWTPLNAWGLWKRRSWARATTIAYYVASLLGCCCLPVAAYGLFTMGRRDVGEELRRNPR